jgi:hypothetical protein
MKLFSTLLVAASAVALSSTVGQLAHAQSDDDDRSIRMVLLSDPFAGIEPPSAPQPADAPATGQMPNPPSPPAPSGEEAMEAFAERMEAFAEEMDAFGEDMDEFGSRMGEWGEEMGAFGERMGAVGDAMGKVAERCDRHQSRTDNPAIIAERVRSEDITIKAVCATGGEERYMSDELLQFVEARDDLTADEKNWFREHRERPSRSYIGD